jgi:hypothetical protein
MTSDDDLTRASRFRSAMGLTGERVSPLLDSPVLRPASIHHLFDEER